MTELTVTKHCEQAILQLTNLGVSDGSACSTWNLVQESAIGALEYKEVRLVEHVAGATLQSRLMQPEINCFAPDDHPQQGQKFRSVADPGKSALDGPLPEAKQGILNDVLFIGDSSCNALQTAPSRPKQNGSVPLPDPSLDNSADSFHFAFGGH